MGRRRLFPWQQPWATPGLACPSRGRCGVQGRNAGCGAELPVSASRGVLWGAGQERWLWGTAPRPSRLGLGGRREPGCPSPLSRPVSLQSDSLVVCDVDPALKEKLRKFRFRKETNNAAILMKIDKERQLVVLEEEFQDISPEELKSELPERQPRYPSAVGRGRGDPSQLAGHGPRTCYKYVHDDGRISYPLCFIFSSPVGCKPEQQMMYAGSKNRLVQAAELTKVFEIRTTEDLTEEWLRERLAFFR
ncbi:Glia maturation factor gamma [Chelonia mydas]|uniref:Glia maturation factor gamma n=1 Tax=Chelonia mydas TaxID=8469 RepID=M7AXP9_CHEMY|nr:Glia maturation factor gamma [Chelonia mydas]